MKLKLIMSKLEEFAPCSLKEEWDNVGLMLGHPDWDIKKCYVALDITDSVIDCAVQNGCNLIVTHHPFIMGGIKSINLEEEKGRQIAKLLSNRIAVYSMHTNFDSCQGGVNDTLCEALGLLDYHVDEPVIYRKGTLEETMRLRDFITLVKNVLRVSYVNYTGDPNHTVKTVAVVGGAGGSMVEMMKDCDVYLTGEAKYHEYQMAESVGLCIVTAGHFETENPALEKIRHLLEEMDLQVVICEVHRGFYQTI